MKYLDKKFIVPAGGQGNDKAMDWDEVFGGRHAAKKGGSMSENSMHVFDTQKEVSPATPYLNISRDACGQVILCTKTNEYPCYECIMRGCCGFEQE